MHVVVVVVLWLNWIWFVGGTLVKRIGEVDVNWVLRQMVSHGFVPKMGMWWKVVGCVVVKNGVSQADLDRIIG